MKITELNLIMENIMDNIEAIRKDKHIKQAVIAEELGITQGAYSHYVRRNQDIKFGVIIRIANKLGCDVVDIIKYPAHWVDEAVIKESECEQCKQKDAVIKSLTEYIEVLKNQLKTK